MVLDMSTKQAIDKYALVSGKILELLQRGVVPWRKPWFATPYMNLATGHLYRGRNPFYCSIDAMLHNWEDPYFVGISQGKALGWKLIKGSKSTWIRFGGSGSKEVEKKDGSKEKEFYSLHKWHNVFHVSHWDDSEADTKIIDLVQRQNEKWKHEPMQEPRISELEAFIKAQDAIVSFGGDRCFYLPDKDQIRMAKYEDFSSPEAFYSVHIHELGHWTGHSSRLNRDMSGQFGSAKYAREELAAELTAAFVCNKLNLEPQMEHHASYLASWLEVIAGDSKAFFKAMDQASKAADLLLFNAGIKEVEEHELVAA